MNLNDFHERYYVPAISHLRECTRLGYESAWHLHLEPQLGGVEMNELNSEIVAMWLQSFEKAGAARKAWAVLRSMLRLARRKGVECLDPATLDIVIPKPAHYEPRLLDFPEIRAQLKGFYGHPLEPWLLSSACLALRPEEALALDWSNVNLRSGTGRIDKGLQWIQGHEVIVEPKTTLSLRTLPYPRFAILRLRQLKGKGRLIGDLTPPQVQRMYKRHCQMDHLPYTPARNLRHSWATTALKSGADVSVVSRFLGHASIETTARFYLKPDMSILRAAQREWEKGVVRD
jgi:integrase